MRVRRCTVYFTPCSTDNILQVEKASYRHVCRRIYILSTCSTEFELTVVVNVGVNDVPINLHIVEDFEVRLVYTESSNLHDEGVTRTSERINDYNRQVQLLQYFLLLCRTQDGH